MPNPLRKTMVYLGLADEELDYQEQEPIPAHHAQPIAPVGQPQRAQVTPLRRSPKQVQGTPEMNEILTVTPKQYKDAKMIAENFREGVPVIMNISQMSEIEARRLIDFASGLAEGLYGRIERVTSKVFLLSPAHVAISGDQAESNSTDEQSFIVER